MTELFTPTFPDWEARARSSFAKQGLMTHLGASISELQPGRCVLMTAYEDELSQHHGFFHAGVSAAIGDSAGGFAGLTLFDADSDVLTVEFKINLIRPAAGHRLIATGTVLRLGRQLTTCEIRVDVENDGRRILCATMLQTLFAKRIGSETRF